VGLADPTVIASHVDRQGYVWFGTMHGVSRSTPHDEFPQKPASSFQERGPPASW
jgi:ligand-binding sensor domain-containing protein